MPSSVNKSYRLFARPKSVIRVAATLIVAGAIVFGAYVVIVAQEHRRSLARQGRESLHQQLEQLSLGRTKAICLYDTEETDQLLKQLEKRADVEELSLELTDVSAIGMASIAAIPRLNKLTLYGWRGISDQGLANLRGMATLENLVLKNTRITNDGLKYLQGLPNLRSLSIFCEPRLGTLNDAGLIQLRPLKQLEMLSITGGWASPQGVEQLRPFLPKCSIQPDDQPTRN